MSSAEKVRLPKRWPKPPPKGQRCDASMGYSYDQLGQPVLNRCPDLAVETALYADPYRALPGEMWLCQRCVEYLASVGTVVRNPRKYPQRDAPDDGREGGSDA